MIEFLTRIFHYKGIKKRVDFRLRGNDARWGRGGASADAGVKCWMPGCVLFAVFLLIVASAPAHSAQVLNVVEQNGKLFVAGGGVTVRYDLLSGKFDIFRSNAELIIERSFSSAEISDKPASGAGAATRTLTMDGKDKLNWFMEQISGPLGAGTKITILRRLAETGVVLKNYISFYDNHPGVMLQIGIKNISAAPMYVSRLTPVETRAPEGGLFLGLDPSGAKALTTYFFCRDDPSLLLQGNGIATSCSDGAGAYYDTMSDRGLVAGFVTQNAAVSTISSMYDPARAAREPDTERLGFTFFRASCRYAPSPSLQAGQAMESETLTLLPAWGPPTQELETYGKFIGALNSARNTRPPSILTYGECCAPDKEMTAAGAFAALDDAIGRLGAPGATVFKLGPGWSKSVGDWSPGAGFPDGMKAAADGVHARKMKAGITIAPFAVEQGSKTAKEHPGWLLNGEEAARLPGGPALTRLDMSKPGAQNMVFTLARRAVREWGFDYIEVDMTGFTTPPKMFFDRSATAQEALLRFIKLIRDAAGPAAIVSVTNAEPTDTLTGVDVAGVAFSAGDAAGKTNLPLEQTYSFLNMTRLYYLNGRARANNAGPIPTGARASVGPAPQEDPAVWLTEAAFYGGALEARIGADPPDAEIFDHLRRLLPVYQRGATPIDIFEKGLGNGFFAQSPSRKLNLKVNTEWGKWNVVGLFNNSPGRDKETGRPVSPDSAATFTVKFADLGLSPTANYLVYDFWDDAFLGEAAVKFSAQAPPMGMKVLGIREELPFPQLLNSNRHYTTGGVEMPALSWDESTDTLSGTLIATAGFPHRLAFHVPAAYVFAAATVEGNPAATAAMAQGRMDVVYVAFTPAASGAVKWTLTFKKTVSK